MGNPENQNVMPVRSETPALGFTGTFAQVCDSKSRISIPQRFRDVLLRLHPDENLSVVTTLTQDKNIAVFPVRNYYRFLETVNQDVPDEQLHKKRHRRMAFEAYSDADTLDNQNRIRIDPRLLQVAGITRDIYIVGFTDRMEIWDRAKYDRFVEKQIQDLPDTMR